ncbi:tail fiber protein [Pseudomonas promysalinigenes]
MIAELAKKAPLDSPDFKGTPRVPTPAVGSTGLQAANMAALTAAVSAGSRQFKTAVIGVSTNLTLTAAQAGNAVQFNTGPVTLTLPATADVGNGASFMLRNPSASATQKLNVASAGSIVDGGSTVTEASIKPFEWMELAASGNAWFVVGRGKLKEAAELDSPLFTGDPKVPTPATSDNSKSAASTEFVRALIKLYGLGERYAGVITDIDDPTLGNGWYAVTLSTTAGTKPVGQTWGTVFVSGRSNTAGTNGRVMQTYFATDSATTRQLFRTYFNGEWTVWEEVSTLTAVKNALAAVGLGTGQAPLCADVDAQTTSGFFYLSTGSSANMPYATNGFLLHFPWNSSSAAMQIYVAASGDKFMYRAKSSGSWRPWKDVPSLDTVISTINNYSRSFKAQAALGLTTSQVLTSAHIGALIQFNANGLTVTLPSSSDVPDGSVMTLRNPRSTQQTLAVTVGSIVEEAATSSTMTLQAYEWVEFASSGSNWFLSARGKVKESATVEQLNSAAASAAPPGMVAHFALPTPPTGWIKRNGAAVSRTAYAALFAVIGTTFGAGDGSTTFNVPDDRELIDRSWTDGLNSADAGRALFSTQAGQLESHIHTGTALSGGAHTHTVPNKREYVDSVTTASVNAVYGDEIREGTDTTTTSSSGTHSHTLSINATGGNETRMANRAYLACIKY